MAKWLCQGHISVRTTGYNIPCRECSGYRAGAPSEEHADG